MVFSQLYAVYNHKYQDFKNWEKMQIHWYESERSDGNALPWIMANRLTDNVVAQILAQACVKFL